MDLAGQPDPQLVQHIDREFELRFMKCRGTAFQDFFSDLMEMAFPSDFCRVRPHGKTGDLKCDGYLTNEKTIFQVYGPDELRSLPRLMSKMADDFNGACQHWSDQIAKWVFVHNSRAGLPAQAIQLLQEFRTTHTGIQIENWGFEELRGVLWKIEPRRLDSFFPGRKGTGFSNYSFALPGPADLEKYLTWIRVRMLAERAQNPPNPTTILDLPVRLADPTVINAFYSPHTGSRERFGDEDFKWHETFDRKIINICDLRNNLRQFPRLLVQGDVGSGKTTLLRQFAKHEAKRGLKRLSKIRRYSRTPILIELGRFGPNRSLEQLMLSVLAESGIRMSPEALRYVATRGYMTFLLDGLDEVGQGLRRECLAQIKELSERYPLSKIVITSRPFPRSLLSFHTLSIVPLCVADIVHSVKQAFGTREEFHKRFPNQRIEDYVRLEMRPEIKRICQRPLMLRMIVSLMHRESALPKSLFGIYSRFIEWIFDWEELNEKRIPVGSCMIALRELAALMEGDASRVVLRNEWCEAIATAFQNSGDQALGSMCHAEDAIRCVLNTGLVVVSDGEVAFCHRSFSEFFVARRLVSESTPAHAHQVALDPGVCRFLCSALPNDTDLLNVHLARCKDVQELLPLLEECSTAGGEGGAFQKLYWAITFANELEIHLTHSGYDSWVDTFAATLDELVTIAVSFKPKALSVLKTAAFNMVMARPWDESGMWFEHLLKGLDQYEWPGVRYHRRLLEADFFNHIDLFSYSDEGCKEERNYKALGEYLTALNKDEFEKAAQELSILLRALRPRSTSHHNRRARVPRGQEPLPF